MLSLKRQCLFQTFSTGRGVVCEPHATANDASSSPLLERYHSPPQYPRLRRSNARCQSFRRGRCPSPLGNSLNQKLLSVLSACQQSLTNFTNDLWLLRLLLPLRHEGRGPSHCASTHSGFPRGSHSLRSRCY